MLREPSSGYDLKTEFNDGARHFWSAELSQIYPALKRLENQRLLNSSVESSPKGPDRKVYKRTNKGRAELISWLELGPVMGTQRFAYIAQLAFFSELRDLDRTLEFFRDLRSKCNQLLTTLEAIETEEALEDKEMSDVEFHDSLCLQMGLTSLRGRIEWCDECMERIRQRQQSSSNKELKHG